MSALAPLSLVEEMVAAMDSTRVLAHWNDIVGVAPTRYSTNPGCQDAADWVYDHFTALVLLHEQITAGDQFIQPGGAQQYR